MTVAARPTLAGLVEEACRAAEDIEGWVSRAVWVVLVAGVAAFLVAGADRPADPYVVPGDDATTQQ